jgi:hypothetical protein
MDTLGIDQNWPYPMGSVQYPFNTAFVVNWEVMSRLCAMMAL